MMEQFLDYFECPACYLVTDEIKECKLCNARACPKCLEDFSKEEFKKNVNMKQQGIRRCTVCLKTG